MSRVLFVTGTDTGVGKTIVTAALVVALRAAGESPYVIKPAQTGADEDVPDLDTVRRLAGDVPGHEGVRLRAPLAPDTAARLEGAELPSLAEQRDGVLAAAADGNTVLVEGAGGVLVNLGVAWNALDLAECVVHAGVPVTFVVVARAGLGTLNHSALTVDAIQRRGLDVNGVVIGSWPERPDLAMEQNLLDLPLMTGVPVLGRIPEGSGSLTPAVFQEHAAAWVRLLD